MDLPVLISQTDQVKYGMIVKTAGSAQNFFCDDLMEEPDKVQEVFDITHGFFMNMWGDQLKNMPQRPFAAWIGGWRGTPDLLNPAMFERFSWRYMRDVAYLLLKYDVVPLFHLDSDWTNGMKYFREFPKGSVILGLEGFILSTGCDAPCNSKRECLDVMYNAPKKYPI